MINRIFNYLSAAIKSQSVTHEEERFLMKVLKDHTEEKIEYLGVSLDDDQSIVLIDSLESKGFIEKDQSRKRAIITISGKKKALEAVYKSK